MLCGRNRELGVDSRRTGDLILKSVGWMVAVARLDMMAE